MSFTMRALLLCSIGVLAAAAASAAQDSQIGGVVQKDYTGATGMRVGSASADLYFRDDVFAGETVSTPAGGSTALMFRDATRIQLGSSSSVVLDKFVYDPSSQQGDAAIKFGKGIFRFVTGEIKNKDAVKLSTPTASLTIRGTDLKIFVDADGSTTMQVLEGAADMTPCGGGPPVQAQAGQAVRTSAGCQVSSVGLSSLPHDSGVDGGGPGGGGTGAPGGNDGGTGGKGPPQGGGDQ